MGRDNASNRILSPRHSVDGHADSLKNTLGATLHDGAQCFVTGEEANYRFLKHSVLHPDGKFVVEPQDRSGRWVRESGTFGVAVLRDGKFQDGKVGGYQPQLLVQFAINGSKLIYTGSVSRLACVTASASMAFATSVHIGSEKDTRKVLATDVVSVINPGECVSIETTPPVDDDVTFALTVVLG